MGGGSDGAPHKGSVAKVNSNRNVPYLNRNDSKRNLNLNWWNNDWSPDYRFLAVRYFHDFSRANQREFCLLVACAIRRAFFRSLQDTLIGEYISSYQVPAFPMRVAGEASEDRCGRYICRPRLVFPHVRYSWRGSNIRLRVEIHHLSLNQE